MNITIILAITLLVVIGLTAAHFNRYLYVFVFLLPGSQVFGLVDPMVFAAKGAFDIHALFGLLIVFAILMSANRWHELSRTTFLAPILVLACLWIYGVAAPVIGDLSTFFYSLKASKEFLTIFAYFAVFLYVRTERDVNWSWAILIGFGIYYSAMESAAQVFGASLMEHTVYSFRKEEIFWKIYPPFWPVILIALLHSYFEYALGATRPFTRIGLASFGLFLTLFRSYLISIVVAVPLVMFLSRFSVTRVAAQFITVAIIGLLSLIAIAQVMGEKRYTVEALSDYFIFSGVKEFKDQTGGSLAGRESLSKDRRKFVEESPYFGYGFIDKDSEFGLLARHHIIGATLGFIDKGDLDVWLKFGYVGGSVLYLTALFIIFKLIILVRKRPTRSIQIRGLTIASMLAIFLLVQPIHAALTYSFSLLPFAIALGLLERENALQSTTHGER